MGTLRVINPGMLSTVQDLGRPGFAAMGVPPGGAADSQSLRIANRLVGNSDGAAGIEMTMLGGAFEFLDDSLIAITGGEAQVDIESATGAIRAAPLCACITTQPGDKVRIGPIVRGVRTYMCIAGGIDVPRVLGSASTLLSAKFGGFEGRALKTGDHVSWFDTRGDDARLPQCSPAVRERSFAARSQISETNARALNEQLLSQSVLRAVDGPHVDEFNEASRDAFWKSAFRVSSRSDRVGARLESVENKIGRAKGGGRMASMGMMCGAVQVPPGGEPIILMADHPTTGGYPVIACVATVDLPKLGQLRPSETVRFSRMTRDEALHAFHEQESRLAVPSTKV